MALDPPQVEDNPITDAPYYWFAMMEAARNRYDFEGAIQARRELARLGIEIRFTARKRSRKGGQRRGA